MRWWVLAAVTTLAACSGGGDGAGAAPVKVAVQTPAGTQSRKVPIRYTLKESPAASVNIAVEFSPDGGLSWAPAAMAPGADGVGGLPATPEGRDYLFCWDSLADLGVADLPACRIRVACSCGASAETGDFRVNNVTNTAPVCAVLPFETDQSGICAVRYTLLDVNGDACSIACSWSTDGVAFFPCTPGPGGDGAGGLAANALGVEHVFSWDCAADLGTVDVSGVVVRIVCHDGTEPGAPATSPPFRVNNVANTPPHCAPEPVEGAQGGHVPIHYRLVDVNNDAVSLVAEFSQNGGASYNAATPGPGGDGNGNLMANAEGVDHVYVWNTNADAAAVDVTVLMRLTFSDGAATHVCPVGPFRVNNASNNPPRARIDDIPGTQSGDVPVRYRLFDAEGDPASISVEFSQDAGLSFAPCTPGPGGDGVGNLTTFSLGVEHLFVWNSLADLGPVDVTGVQLRLTPADAQAGEPDVGLVLRVNNVANVPPSCEIVDVYVDQSGLVYLTHYLRDPDLDPAGIACAFSQDGGMTFAPCTPGPGGDGVGNLTTSSTGTRHVWVWDSLADLGPTDQDDIQVRITPSDSAPGTPDTTRNFTVDNVTNTPPAVAIEDPSGIQSGLVTLRYGLTDVNNDACSIAVAFSQDGGLSFAPATPGPGGDGTAGLAADGQGVPHVYVWDSAADIGATDQQDIQIRITPSDGVAGTRDTTANFIVRNATNTPPTAVVRDPTSTESGTILIEYTLFDPNGDACSILVEFSQDGGLTFAPATQGAGGDGVSGLAALGAGVGHSYAWNSLADVGGTFQSDVQIRITPSDAAPGARDATGNFTVNNQSNTPPAIKSITTPSGVQTGVVPIAYKLKDVNGDPCSIAVEFSQDGGATFSPATMGAGGDGISGLAASSAGTDHSYAWDSAADLGPGTQGDIRIRITPSDGVTGAAAATNNFTVSN